MSIRIGSRDVGDGHPCFITFEAGATHDGLASALALVDVAAHAGADAVKFQIFDPDRLVSDKTQLFTYDMLADRATGRTETVSEPLYDILKRRCLPRADWRTLKAAADRRNLAFFATVGFEDDIAFVAELGCESIKIASADVNCFPLIRMAAKTGSCIQLDTGNAQIGEIEAAVDVIRSEGNDRIIIHQCPSGYPARLPSIHLRMIPTLKAMFGVPVAYSDHTPGWEMDVAAVALGANLVEKTITLDRTVRSPEHIFSLEPQDAKAFIGTIRDVETALGEPRRILSPAELEKRKLIRRSAFLRTQKQAGEAIVEADVEYRRPGTGLWPAAFSLFEGRLASRDLAAGTMLGAGDFR
jgi:N,N'-diacetyllegionaminate synthase